MTNKKQYSIKTINHIKTVFYPIKNIPAIKLELIVKSGSRDEVGESWGAYHLLEHLCHQGTQELPTQLDLELFKEEHGLIANAYTSSERVGYWVKAPSYSLPQAFHFLNQLVFKPTFPQDKFKNEINIITQEYNDKWDSPYNRFNQKITQQLLGPTHPYVRDGLGQPQYLTSLNHVAIKKLHRQAFCADNLILVVTGNFTQTKVEKLIKNTLKPFPKKQLSHSQIPPIQPQKKHLLYSQPIQQERIIISWHIPGNEKLSLTDRIRFSIARYILGGSSRSLINQIIREKFGLAYRSGSGFYLYPQAGIFEVWAYTEPKNRQKTIKLLTQITYEFVNQPLDSHKLKLAKSFLNASTIISFDSLDEISSSISNNLFHYDQIFLPKDYFMAAEKISAQSINKLLQPFITSKREYTSILTPQK